MKKPLPPGRHVMSERLLAGLFLVFCFVNAARSQTISGRITTAEKGEDLPGVSILVKGTSQGTTTDNTGKYTLKLPNANATLVVSFIGYVKQEVNVAGRSTVDITMQVDDKSLQEVVVVGYGTQEKVNLTGAVGVADAKRLENRPIANAGEGLQGVIPNLNVNVRNGDPAQPITFNVRGFESINGGAPLVLVDNVPMDLNRVNPNDIENISVLKDASASAVYGARAAFGVVLVTTKKAKSGKVSVSVGSQFSIARPIFNMDLVTDPYEFVTARNAANVRTSGIPAYDADMVAGTKAWSENPATAKQWGVVNGVLRYYGNNDYQNTILTKTAPTSQHNVSVSGGTDKTKFLVSLGYFSKDGYLKSEEKNEKFKRYNLLMKGDFQINNWLALDNKIVFNSENSDKPHFYNWDVNINSLARVNPTQQIQFPDLEYYITPGDREKYAPYIGKYFEGTVFSPYLLDGGRQTYTNNDLWLTQGATLTPLKGLKIRSDFSYQIFSRAFQDVQSKVDVVTTNLLAANIVNNGFSGDDWIRNENNNNQYYVFNAFAEYKLPLPVSHDLTAMVGFNQERGLFRYSRAQARGLITPNVLDLSATTGVQQVEGSKQHVSLRGMFYRLNYIFKEKYLVEFNGRYDGTSRFPQESRFGFFPSVSAGWRISNEKFMAGASSWLDNLKIRASYGTLGNQILLDNNRNQIYYPYIATMGSGTSPYMFTNSLIPIVTPAGLVSPSLTWETVVTKNIGLDVTALRGRFDASLDIYTRDTKDMLMNVSYPALLGTDAPKQNAADLRTKGWELSLTWRDKFKRDWNYDFTLALADNISTITRFNNPTGAIPNNNHTTPSNSNIFYVGQRIGEIWGLETAGIFQSADEVAAAPKQTAIGANWRPGDIRYADLNGDGQITLGANTLSNPGDRRIIGNTTPRYTFGINGGIGYKNLRLSVFFQGIGSRDYFPFADSWNWFFPFNAGHIERYYITDTWTETNRDAYFPAAHISTNDKKNVQTQTRYLQNAGYIRLKNVTLSYNLPQTLMQRIGVGSAQVFATGMNLWEYTRMRKPLDPETIATGAIEYPMQRITTLGINLNF